MPQVTLVTQGFVNELPELRLKSGVYSRSITTEPISCGLYLGFPGGVARFSMCFDTSVLIGAGDITSLTLAFTVTAQTVASAELQLGWIGNNSPVEFTDSWLWELIGISAAGSAQYSWILPAGDYEQDVAAWIDDLRDSIGVDGSCFHVGVTNSRENQPDFRNEYRLDRATGFSLIVETSKGGKMRLDGNVHGGTHGNV